VGYTHNLSVCQERWKIVYEGSGNSDFSADLDFLNSIRLIGISLPFNSKWKVELSLEVSDEEKSSPI
jgi:hypothetical protein